ncbi:ABC transporter permease [Actinocrinis puniceicyclus]|uniref:ABC transporter permease n=1 Tax=Actinocrinis puniceicyclus TaxID=977794 RepID=A0A8J7WN75_9ACTN|nr:ABC transporter permease [Actinocrinis puniceicyclus]MBS2965491.1 ABC transporter permease [Actinocrinis puniceicyclus]
MSLVDYIRQFFADPQFQHGYDGIWQRIAEHCWYSLIAFLCAAAIGLPLALLTGHFGRGDGPIAALAAVGRAMPSLGLIVLLAVKIGVFNFYAVLIPLVALAVPPILLTTHEGLRAVERSVVDAARGMGMRPWQVLLRAEIPSALPLILSGLRTAAVQVVSTMTIAAVIPFGGLGRYVVDGLSEYRYYEVVGGGFLVVVLSVLTLVLFAVLNRLLVSPGLRAGNRG